MKSNQVALNLNAKVGVQKFRAKNVFGGKNNMEHTCSGFC